MLNAGFTNDTAVLRTGPSGSNIKWIPITINPTELTGIEIINHRALAHGPTVKTVRNLIAVVMFFMALLMSKHFEYRLFF